MYLDINLDECRKTKDMITAILKEKGFDYSVYPAFCTRADYIELVEDNKYLGLLEMGRVNMNSIWMNLEIETYSFLQLAKDIIPECEYPVYGRDKNAIVATLQAGTKELQYKFLIPRFHYITGVEERAIFDGVWDETTDYESSEMPYGFYFPDCELSMLKNVLPGGFDEVIDKLIESNFYEDNCLVFNKQLLYRAVFIILHEYGHYISYKKCSFGKVRFAHFVHDSKQKFREVDEELRKKASITKEEQFMRLQVYRNCPDEKEADDYAFAHLEAAVQCAIQCMREKMKESK